jgi:hypothetical protein
MIKHTFYLIHIFKQNLLPVVFESYKFWPLATLLNFYVIPLHNRFFYFILYTKKNFFI